MTRIQSDDRRPSLEAGTSVGRSVLRDRSRSSGSPAKGSSSLIAGIGRSELR